MNENPPRLKAPLVMTAVIAVVVAVAGSAAVFIPGIGRPVTVVALALVYAVSLAYFAVGVTLAMTPRVFVWLASGSILLIVGLVFGWAVTRWPREMLDWLRPLIWVVGGLLALWLVVGFVIASAGWYSFARHRGAEKQVGEPR